MNNQEKDILDKFEKQLRLMDNDIQLPNSLKSDNLLCLIEDIVPEEPQKFKSQNNIIVFVKKFAIPIAAMIALIIMFPFMYIQNNFKNIEKSDEIPNLTYNTTQDTAEEILAETCEEEMPCEQNEIKPPQSNEILPRESNEIVADSGLEEDNKPLSENDEYEIYRTVKNKEELQNILNNALTDFKNSAPKVTKSQSSPQKNNTETENNIALYSASGFEKINSSTEVETISEYNNSNINYDLLFTVDEQTKLGFFDDCMISVIKNDNLTSVIKMPYLNELISLTYINDYVTVIYEGNTQLGTAICAEFFDENLNPVFSYAQNGTNENVNEEYDNEDNYILQINSKYSIPKDENGNIIEDKILPHIYDLKYKSKPLEIDKIKIKPDLSEFTYEIETHIKCKDSKLTSETSAILK